MMNKSDLFLENISFLINQTIENFQKESEKRPLLTEYLKEKKAKIEGGRDSSHDKLEYLLLSIYDKKNDQQFCEELTSYILSSFLHFENFCNLYKDVLHLSGRKEKE